jgi:class 3 adenylate cyclase
VLSPPPIEFATRDGLHIAFQRAGDGPVDLVYVAGATAASLQWDDPNTARGLRRLASFTRLVTFDQQGMGFSDRMDLTSPPTIDDLADDLEAVIAAAGVTDPVLLGTHNGGAVAAVYAARHPVRQLVLCNTWARLEAADDFPIGLSADVLDLMGERYETEWGTGRISDQYASRRGDMPPGHYELATTSHNQLAHLFRINRTYDIRDVLPTITSPTLVIHLDRNLSIPAVHGRYIASAIPGARLVLVPGTDHLFLRNYATPVIDEVELFVTGRVAPFVDRLRTTMLFTDIVDSTPLTASMGDERWSALIDEHNARVRRQVVRHRGHEVKSTGDGFLVAFDTPEAAVQCALDALTAVTDLGIELRAGVHVGEVVHMGKGDMAGVAVHFAQRLCARAEGGQVLVSADVRAECDGDEGEGSRVTFDDRGKATFKGIPGKWEIFEAGSASPT